MKLEHEVNLNTRVDESNRTITELLTLLLDGKAYVTDPDTRLPQAAQKGNVCWYYALLLIRTRYGKAVPETDKHRQIEKIISTYRKELTNIDQLNLFSKVSLACFPSLPLENMPLRSYDDYLEIALKEDSSFGLYHHLCMEVRNLMVGGQPFTKKSQTEKKDFLINLIKTVFVDLPCIDEMLKHIHSVDVTHIKAAYSGFLSAIIQLFQLANGGHSDANEALIRISILYVSLIHAEQYNWCDDRLTFKEAMQFIEISGQLDAVINLYKNLELDIKPDFFEKILTVGVENKTAIRFLQSTANDVYKALKSEHYFLYYLSQGKVTPESVKLAKQLYSFAQAYAYYNILEFYELKKISWFPKDGFKGLTEAINQHGALVVNGRLGLPQYNASPLTGPKIGSRTIQFWDRSAMLSISNDNRTMHSIVVIGTQEISSVEEQLQYVLFLDPNNASLPSQERQVYRMDYADFIQRLVTLDGNEFNDPLFTPEDSGVYYAVAR